MDNALSDYKRIAAIINERIHKGFYPLDVCLLSENSWLGVTRVAICKASTIYV